jgi:hypothetical protein
MEILIVQILLGVGLFFLINWIGKHSYSIGYVEISIFVKSEDAPALNFLIRVLTPVVYLIIVSAILYYFGLDKYVRNIFLVNVYYIFFRLFFNLLTNRGVLINWYRQFIYWGAIMVISYFMYEKIIKLKANILPDFTTIANELWIIVLIFVFQVINNIQLSQDGTEKRKLKYLKSRYNYFKKKYGKQIKEIVKNDVLEAITYAIIIYEDFNRPKLIRIIENVKFRVTKKAHTLGVMQITTSRLLTDSESVMLGATKIVEAYNSYLQRPIERDEEYDEWSAMIYIIGDYNTGESYGYEVAEIAKKIKEVFYGGTNDELVSKKIGF